MTGEVSDPRHVPLFRVGVESFVPSDSSEDETMLTGMNEGGLIEILC